MFGHTTSKVFDNLKILENLIHLKVTYLKRRLFNLEIPYLELKRNTRQKYCNAFRGLNTPNVIVANTTNASNRTNPDSF